MQLLITNKIRIYKYYTTFTAKIKEKEFLFPPITVALGRPPRLRRPVGVPSLLPPMVQAWLPLSTAAGFTPLPIPAALGR